MRWLWRAKTVSLARLGKKLQREAAANPKKAVFLGLATVVAVYFWIPLVKGWIGPNTGNTTTSATQTVAATATPAPATPSAASQDASGLKPDGAAAGPSWQKIAEWMHNDPRTMTAPPLNLQRDPFEATSAAMATAARQAEASKPKRPTVTPTEAGLVLTSTIIGPQRRVAQISGRVYRVGQIVSVGEEKQSGERETENVAFKLVEVHPRRAVLESDGQRFELTIPEPIRSKKMELIGTVSVGK